MKKKRDQKKRRKIKKKKKKKHQRLVKALNMAVKIKGLILQEETTWEGIHALKAAKYIENMSIRAKEATFKAYKGLYGTDLPVDMASAFCDGDEFFEYIESEPPPINLEKNYIYVWDSRNMAIKATLKGHKQRVVYMALSPDSRNIVTGAGDETIRFWKTFGYENQKYNFNINEPETKEDNDDIVNMSDNKIKSNILFSNFDIR